MVLRWFLNLQRKLKGRLSTSVFVEKKTLLNEDTGRKRSTTFKTVYLILILDCTKVTLKLHHRSSSH